MKPKSFWIIRSRPCSTGVTWYRRGIVYWRILGVGYYRFKGERPWLLLPGRPPGRYWLHPRT